MPRLSALAGTLTISWSAIFVRLAEVSPETAAFFRCLYALPVLFLLRWLTHSRDQRSPRDRSLALLAGLFLGIDLNTWHYAIEHIGAGLSTVLGNTQVVFVALGAWALHGERPRRQALLLLPFVFLGAALISGLGRSDAYGAHPVLGVGFGLATGVSYALFLLTVRAANRDLAPAAGPLLDVTLGAAAITLILGGIGRGLDPLPHWPAHGWLAALALGSQVIGWMLITWALPRLPALETSVLLPLQPLATMIWGWLLFAERLSPLQGLGVAVLLTTVTLLSLSGSVAADGVEEAR